STQLCSASAHPGAPPLPYTALFRPPATRALAQQREGPPPVREARPVAHAVPEALARFVVEIPRALIDAARQRLRNGMSYRTGLRSEEHTSELQSRGHLVCRLLLEKK